MIQQLINYLLDTAKRHKAVSYAAYKRDWNVNDMHNHPYYQFIIDDECLLDTLVSESGILTLKLSAVVLGFVKTNESVLNTQETALHIVLDWMEKIKTTNELQLQIRDYSILSFSEYTDDNCSGVKLDIQFVIPSPVNLCEYQTNFIDKEDEQEQDTLELAYTDECTDTTHTPIKNNTNLKLNPIRLK